MENEVKKRWKVRKRKKDEIASSNLYVKQNAKMVVRAKRELTKMCVYVVAFVCIAETCLLP